MKNVNFKIAYLIKIKPMVWAYLYNYNSYYQVYEDYETNIEVTVNEKVYIIDYFKHFPGEKITVGNISSFIAGCMHNYSLSIFSVMKEVLGVEGKNLTVKEMERIIKEGL